jgi:putative ABC transport system permease protein
MLSLVGAALGLLLGGAGLMLAVRLFPNFPMAAPLWAPLAAVGVALTAGLVFGVMPARRAARLDPVAALSRR